MTARAWFDPYVGLPHLDRGRDESGVDCWGLAMLIYRRELNVELPTYGDISGEDLIKVGRAIATGADHEPWHRVEPPYKPFDIAVMTGLANESGRLRRLQMHVGIMVSPTQLVHVEANIDSVLLPVTHASVRFRLKLIVRHKSLV